MRTLGAFLLFIFGSCLIALGCCAEWLVFNPNEAELASYEGRPVHQFIDPDTGQGEGRPDPRGVVNGSLLIGTAGVVLMGVGTWLTVLWCRMLSWRKWKVAFGYTFVFAILSLVSAVYIFVGWARVAPFVLMVVMLVLAVPETKPQGLPIRGEAQTPEAHIAARLILFVFLIALAIGGSLFFPETSRFPPFLVLLLLGGFVAGLIPGETLHKIWPKIELTHK